VVVGVCDLSKAVAESTAERFGVAEHFTAHRAMLEAVSPDVVHVTTPLAAHFPVAVDALAAGAHVIVEKPIVTGEDELGQLIAEAERRGRVLVENYNYVFNTQLLAIAGLIESGALGEVVHVDVDLALDILSPRSPFVDRNLSHPALALPGGAVADFLPHLASLVHALVGRHNSAEAQWSKRRPDSPLPFDDLRALITAERGGASISFSATSQPDGFWLRVHGTRMRVEANLFSSEMTVKRLTGGPAPLGPIVNGLGEIRSIGHSAIADLWGKLRGAPGAYAGLWELIGRTYGAITIGGAPPVSPDQILEVNRLVADLSEGAPA